MRNIVGRRSDAYWIKRVVIQVAELQRPEGVGSKYVIIVRFDNGESAYRGTKALGVAVPEGASKIDYQRDILKAFSEKSGIPLDVLEGKVMFKRVGGKGEVDGILSTLEDIVVDGKVIFKKDDVITIIEMELTITGKSFEELFGGAIKDLKNHFSSISIRILNTV